MSENDDSKISEFDYKLGKQLLSFLQRKPNPNEKELNQIERIKKILEKYENQNEELK